METEVEFKKKKKTLDALNVQYLSTNFCHEGRYYTLYFNKQTTPPPKKIKQKSESQKDQGLANYSPKD